MIDEYQDKRLKSEDELKETVQEARILKDFKDSEEGRLVIGKLKETYKLYVVGAINESQRYRNACRAIEELVGWMGDKVNAGDTAEEILQNLESGTVDDDY